MNDTTNLPVAQARNPGVSILFLPPKSHEAILSSNSWTSLVSITFSPTILLCLLGLYHLCLMVLQSLLHSSIFTLKRRRKKNTLPEWVFLKRFSAYITPLRKILHKTSKIHCMLGSLLPSRAQADITNQSLHCFLLSKIWAELCYEFIGINIS